MAMQRTKLVQEIIGKAIEPNGFKLSLVDRRLWLFMKQTEELKQEIAIQLFSKDSIRLSFSTNAFGHRTVYGTAFAKDGEPKGDIFDAYRFGNEEEFIGLLEYFKKIIFDYGFEALEKMSIPTTEIRPTKETNRYLFENHDELNIRHREMFGINESTTSDEIFTIINNYLTQTQGQAFEDVKETLIGLAAVAGSVLVDISGGDWVWDSNSNICWVSNKAKYPTKCCPLVIIIDCWRDNTGNVINRLNYYYKLLKKT